jgi:hypothetical protein
MPVSPGVYLGSSSISQELHGEVTWGFMGELHGVTWESFMGEFISDIL